VKRWLRAVSLAFGLVLATRAGSDNGSSRNSGTDVTATLNAFRVDRGPGGKERLTPARKAKVGSVVEYQAEYRNHGKVAVKNLEVDVPIPPGMEYLSGTARPAEVFASVDGQKFGPVPLLRTVKNPDGTERREPVPPADYRFLRWRVAEIGAESAVQLFVRMKLVPGGARK